VDDVPGFLSCCHGFGLVNAIARDGANAKGHEDDHLCGNQPVRRVHIEQAARRWRGTNAP
jgi:hypothetical protein